MKKAISLFLCVIMCFMVFVMSTPVAFAASYNGTCGTGVSWSLDTSAGVLTISGSGEMNDYSFSSLPGWDRYQAYIKTVVFDDGVTYVGSYAFYNGGNGNKYKKLTAVDFGDVEIIGDYAFRGCAALSSITGGEDVYIIYPQAFRGCSSMTAFPFTGVVEIGNGAFCGAGLENITLPSTVRTIRAEAFENCADAETIFIPSLLTRAEDRAFADCTSVSYITYNAVSLSYPGIGVFSGTGCESGATLEIASNVHSVPDGLFASCSNLTSVVNGSGLISLGKESFAHTGITQFDIKSNLNSIDPTTFADCTSLAAFTVAGDNETFSANSMGILFNKDGDQIVRYPAGRTAVSYSVPSGVLTIADGAFRECKYLKSFTAGSPIIQIPESCFANCYALTDITLGSTVSKIKVYAFINCKALKNISMSGVSYIDNYAFSQCSALESLTTPSSLRIIGDYAFSDCKNLTTVTISSGATSVGKFAFYKCKSLTSVSIPSTVTSIKDYAFYDCTSLKTVTVPSSVATIGNYAFGFYYVITGTAPVPDFKIYCNPSAYAYTYAADNGIATGFSENSAEQMEIAISDTEQSAEKSLASTIFETIKDFIFNFDYIRFFTKIINFIINFAEAKL